MAYIYKHKQHGYQIKFNLYFPDGTKKSKNKYCKKKAKATVIKQNADRLEALSSHNQLTHEQAIHFLHEKLISKEEASLLTGNRAGSATWADLSKKYELYSKASHTAYNSQVQIRRLYKLEEYWREIPIDSITPHTILEWQAERTTEVSVKTVTHERGILSQLLDMAVEAGSIPYNPVTSKLLKNTLKLDKSRLPVSLNYDEVSLLLEAIKNSPHLLKGQIYLATLIFLFAGLRRGEACYLTYEDMQEGRIV